MVEELGICSDAAVKDKQAAYPLLSGAADGLDRTLMGLDTTMDSVNNSIRVGKTNFICHEC